MRMMMFSGLALALTGCGSAAVDDAPLGPPAYQQPSNGAAKTAFKAALQFDRVDNPIEIDEEKLAQVSMTNYQNSVRENRKVNANRAAKRLLSAYRKMTIGSCDWQRVDERRVPVKSRARLPNLPDAAWLCEFEVMYQTDRKLGDKMHQQSTGYFFKQDGGFIYAGPYDDPYR